MGTCSRFPDHVRRTAIGASLPSSTRQVSAGPAPKADLLPVQKLTALLLTVARRRRIRLRVQFSADKAPKRTLSPVFATQSGFIDRVRFKFPKTGDSRRQTRAI